MPFALLVSISLFSFLAVLISPAIAGDDLKLGGYYKDLLIASETTSTKKPYVYFLQRLRIDAEAKLSDTLSARLMIDNEFLLNDFSASPDFNLVRENNQRELAFWDTHNVLVDARDVYWTEYFYRAYLQYYTPLLSCIVGKQNVDWDRMRFYHPFDLFNPISPLTIEKDEKMGVDAVNVELRPQPFMSWNFIFAPDRNMDPQSFGLKFLNKVGDYDIIFMYADINKDEYAGFAFDGYLKDAGFRGEITYTWKHRDNFDDFLRATVGYDQSFTPKAHMIVEYFYNGGAKIADAPLFLTDIAFSRRMLSMTKHILGAGLEYEISGVTKLNNYLFYDFEGSSFFYNPEFKWEIKPNADLLLGCQIFAGDSESEYGNYHNLFYAEMKLFF